MPTWGDLLKEAGTATEGFEPLPTGMYDVKVVKAAHKVAQSGKSMFEVQFQVTSGPHANRMVWNRFVVVPDSPRALGYFFANMKSLGLDTAFFATSPADDAVAAALEGAIARIEVGQTEYNGATRNEVKKVLAPEGGAIMASPISASPGAPVFNAAPAAPTSAPAAPF
jgi:hypothetical protein